MRGAVLTLTFAAVTGILMWLLALWGAGNLHASDRAVVQVALLLVGGICGGIAGATISRHRNDAHPLLFASTSGALAGALCGAAYVLAMGIAYVGTFGGAPVSFTDGLVVLLAYPVFAALGALAGLIPGAALGASAAYLANHVAPISMYVKDRP